MASRIGSTIAEGCAIPRPIFPAKKKKAFHGPPSTRYKARQHGLKRERGLRRQSKGLRATTAKYRKLEAEFLARPENRNCAICRARREHGENIRQEVSTEVHHRRGRIGRLLCYVPEWIPSCFFCRTFPHANPRKAREWNLLSSAVDWNTFPKDAS